jgi:hypothetical protein
MKVTVMARTVQAFLASAIAANLDLKSSLFKQFSLAGLLMFPAEFLKEMNLTRALALVILIFLSIPEVLILALPLVFRMS